MSKRSYWIKERYNPQLGTYYVAMGQMTRCAAMAHESPVYGDNIMHEYKTASDYHAKMDALRKLGKKVRPL